MTGGTALLQDVKVDKDYLCNGRMKKGAGGAGDGGTMKRTPIEEEFLFMSLTPSQISSFLTPATK